ncbi:unnamed protein product, partial [Scytosiphon promiscuus]
EEGLSSVSPVPASTVTWNSDSEAVVMARLAEMGRGPLGDKTVACDQDVPSPFHALTHDALLRRQGVEEEEDKQLVAAAVAAATAAAAGGGTGGRGDGGPGATTASGGVSTGADEGNKSESAYPPLSATGGDDDANDNADPAVTVGGVDAARTTPKSLPRSSMVSPSSAPRYPVSKIKVPGNPAAVAADKRRRLQSFSSDDDSYASHGSERALGSPPLPAFVSRGFSSDGSAPSSIADIGGGSGTDSGADSAAGSTAPAVDGPYRHAGSRSPPVPAAEEKASSETQ